MLSSTGSPACSALRWSEVMRSPWGFRPHEGQASVAHALEPASDRLLDLALGGALGDGVPLVPRLLALADADLDLGAAVEEVERQRDDGQALLADAALDLVDLDAV